jgi:hypothetical protein
MPNLRIVYDNAVKRASSVTASSSAGSLIAENLRTASKENVWRSTGTSATVTVVFPSAELVGCVSLPFCNLTPTATMRVRGYTEVDDADPAVDTGPQIACGAVPLGSVTWGTTPLGVNAFSYVGAPYATVWFAISAFKKLVIDIDDADNDSGYVESAMAVIGNYWSPKTNANWGAGIQVLESSKHTRSDGGDLRTELGFKSRKVSIDLQHMPPADRAQVWNIAAGNGMAVPLLFSLYPEDEDPVLEQTYQIYCKLSQQSKIAHQYHKAFQAPLELEEV